MLRSLFAGISGLRSNQTMLDVVGNNIANANTTGFKSSNVIFQDTLSQMLTTGNAPGAGRGGTNPVQVGLGVSVGGTTTNFGQGAAQVTGRASDLMIDGDGFFVVNRDGEQLYTRAGSFNFDASGNLVTLDGDLVQGYAWNAGTNSFDNTLSPIRIPGWGTDAVTSMEIGRDGTVTVVNGTTPSTPFRIALANFANPEGLEKIGDTAFRATGSSGGAALGAAGVAGIGSIRGSALEMSNVDLAAEFTNLIIAQRGFQATSRVITTSDQVLEELVNIKR